MITLNKVPISQQVQINTQMSLSVDATSNALPLSYEWFTFSPDDGTWVTTNVTQSTYSFSGNSTPSTALYRCTVTDSGESKSIDTTIIYIGDFWLSGPEGFSVIPSDANQPAVLTFDTSVRGGLHVYETIEKMCNAEVNVNRVKYGQIAIVPSANPNDYSLIRAYKFVERDPLARVNYLLNEGLDVKWAVGVEWVLMDVMTSEVDGDTIQIIDNKLVAAGIPPDNKTIVIQDGVLSAVPYDQDLNTFNSVNFHDVTTNVVIENTMAIQTYAYATSSTVGRNSLSAINNSEATQGSIGGTTFAFNSVDFNYSVTGFADTTFPTLTLVRGRLYSFDLTNVSSSHPFALRLTNGGSTTPVPGTTNNNVNTGAYNVTITYQVPLDAPSIIYYQCTEHYQMLGTINIVNPGPYNVLEVTADSKKYIPLDLTRANTFLLTLSDASNSIGTYDGFVLINKAPLTSSFDVSLDANTTYQTFIQPDSIKGKIYTITLFVKHLKVMSTLPLKLYTGAVHTDANRIADVFSVTQIPVKWSAGSYPALYTTPANPNYELGSEDVIMYTTYDAGATWYGFIGGTDLR